MANPVMNSIVKDWSAQTTTPAGYPAMPGYQPASQQAHNPFGGSTNPYGAPEESGSSGAQAGQAADRGPVYGVPQAAPAGYDDSMASYEAMMNAPAADAVDRGVMTYDDVVVKSIICFGLLLVGASVGWFGGLVAPALAMLALLPALLVAVGLSLFIQFSKTIRPALVIAFSLVEGFILGALSFSFELRFPGIVVTAVVATLVVIGTTLGAFTMGFVRNSATLTRIAGIGSLAFFVYYAVSLLLSSTGLVNMAAVNNVRIWGIPLGVIIGAIAVFVGVTCLVRDFDAVKVGVAYGVPARWAWQCTFAIMTDVVWIYLEILKILSYFMRRD
ncbi:Bax inhibitor-1/YccA family protein [Cellulomonas flavigena]|uniref:Bax inhibitor-1/YccA family protein n=1 Tax=Cellulomonas flavigena TaxID=1711 RepID=UPI00065F9F2E|nr:Bax inhibitor-1/YccA family protein [Cellulomonas flavigena]